MSGFAMMFLQYPNLLEFQRKMSNAPSGNLETILGPRGALGHPNARYSRRVPVS